METYIYGLIIGGIIGCMLTIFLTPKRKSEPDPVQEKLAFKTREWNDVFYLILEKGNDPRSAIAVADAAVAAWEERFPEAWKVFTK